VIILKWISGWSSRDWGDLATDSDKQEALPNMVINLPVPYRDILVELHKWWLPRRSHLIECYQI
jgi:hypothetical protein